MSFREKQSKFTAIFCLASSGVMFAGPFVYLRDYGQLECVGLICFILNLEVIGSGLVLMLDCLWNKFLELLIIFFCIFIFIFRGAFYLWNTTWSHNGTQRYFTVIQRVLVIHVSFETKTLSIQLLLITYQLPFTYFFIPTDIVLNQLLNHESRTTRKLKW